MLRDDTKNGCVADYMGVAVTGFMSNLKGSSHAIWLPLIKLKSSLQQLNFKINVPVLLFSL